MVLSMRVFALVVAVCMCILVQVHGNYMNADMQMENQADMEMEMQEYVPVTYVDNLAEFDLASEAFNPEHDVDVSLMEVDGDAESEVDTDADAEADSEVEAEAEAEVEGGDGTFQLFSDKACKKRLVAGNAQQCYKQPASVCRQSYCLQEEWTTYSDGRRVKTRSKSAGVFAFCGGTLGSTGKYFGTVSVYNYKDCGYLSPGIGSEVGAAMITGSDQYTGGGCYPVKVTGINANRDHVPFAYAKIKCPKK